MMHPRFFAERVALLLVTALLFAGACAGTAFAQLIPTNDPPNYGPYNATLLEIGRAHV